MMNRVVTDCFNGTGGRSILILMFDWMMSQIANRQYETGCK